jgi:segregation and condensation protein B
MSRQLKAVIECLLFLAEEPLAVKRIRETVPGAETREIVSALEELKQDYQKEDRGMELREVAGGFQLRTRPEFKDFVKRFRRVEPSRLSRPAMETLAIIAYKQPILKSEVERFRGVEVGGILRTLMEKGLIRIVGRKNLPGRPIIYGTTKKFLGVFELKDLSELPTLEEFTQITGETLDAHGEDS